MNEKPETGKRTEMVQATETSGDLVPLLKDTRAVKAAAEAIGMPVEAFADRFEELSGEYRRRTEDAAHLPNKDFEQVIGRLSSLLKEQQVKIKDPEDAFLCGVALGWVFAYYVSSLLPADSTIYGGEFDE